MMVVYSIIEGVSMVRDNVWSILQTNQTLMVNLAIIFTLNVISTTLGNLKTMLLTKGAATRAVYVTTFIDAMVCAITLKFIADFSGVFCILAFALGRLCGVYWGNHFEKKLALGILEINIYKHPREGIALADSLREMGYSVTTYRGQGINGTDRLDLTIIIPRRELPKLREALGDRVNMTIKDVSKTYGKIGQIQTD
ncbi:MAG: hypothetical protein GXY34_02345 [Syntrophomonadaceae bacterium]|nr:hypothetical protein [Syntrophomonadaceae bacterium]